MIGRTLAHYRILSLAGQGGMGEVFLAEDTRLGRNVALKVLPPEAASDAERSARFRREARAIAALNHPNIVTIHSVEETEGIPFLTMELVEGRTLAAHIPEEGLPLDQLHDLALQLTDAIAAAHEQGVIHRDLKPLNVMVTPKGRIKVLDFGLARMEAGPSNNLGATTEALTQEGFVVGTVPYMSPEQLQGRAAGPSSDVFSLGILLYEMGAGHRPFLGESPVEVASAILRDTPVSLSTLRRDVQHLDPIVARCLEKDPALRWPTARELHQALLTSRAPTIAMVATRAVQLPVVTAPRLAVMDFANITQDPQVDWLATGIAETVTTDLKKLPALSVVSRDRVVQATAQTGGSPLETGKRLGAQWVVHGSFQRLGDAIRVTAAFSDVQSGEISETAKIDGTLAGIFALQDAVVSALLSGLKVRASDTERDKIEKPQTLDIGAYEYYVKGRMKIFRMGKGALAEAETAFRRASELDPEYALPYSGLGQCYSMRFIGTADPADLNTSILNLRRAVELDPDLTDPYVWLTYAHSRLHQFVEASQAAERAVTLDPDDPNANYMRGVMYILWADEDPNPDHLKNAELSLWKTIDLVPRYAFGYTVLAAVFESQGRLEEARRALQRAVEIEESGNFELSRFVGSHSHLALVEYRIGEMAACSQSIERSLKALEGVEHVYRHQFFAMTHSIRADIAYTERRYDDAVGDFLFAIRHIDQNPKYLGMGRIRARALLGLARSQHKLGLPREAQKTLEDAKAILNGRTDWDMSWIWGNSHTDLLMELAGAETQLGQKEAAMQSLDKAARRGFLDAHRLRTDPLLVSLAQRPDFLELTRTVSRP